MRCSASEELCGAALKQSHAVQRYCPELKTEKLAQKGGFCASCCFSVPCGKFVSCLSFIIIISISLFFVCFLLKFVSLLLCKEF